MIGRENSSGHSSLRPYAPASKRAVTDAVLAEPVSANQWTIRPSANQILSDKLITIKCLLMCDLEIVRYQLRLLQTTRNKSRLKMVFGLTFFSENLCMASI